MHLGLENKKNTTDTSLLYFLLKNKKILSFLTKKN